MTPNKTPTAETAKKTTHTPGPWNMERDNTYGVVGQDRWGIFSGTARVAAISRDNAQANARLIAQAPAMLEALRVLLTHRPHKLDPDATPQDYRDFDAAAAILAAIDGSAR